MKRLVRRSFLRQAVWQFLSCPGFYHTSVIFLGIIHSSFVPCFNFSSAFKFLALRDFFLSSFLSIKFLFFQDSDKDLCFTICNVDLVPFKNNCQMQTKCWQVYNSSYRKLKIDGKIMQRNIERFFFFIIHNIFYPRLILNKE